MKSFYICYLGLSGQSDDMGEPWLVNFKALKASNAAPYSKKDKNVQSSFGVQSLPQLQNGNQRVFPSLWGKREMKGKERKKLKCRIALIWELLKQSLPPQGQKCLPLQEKKFQHLSRCGTASFLVPASLWVSI